MRASGNVLHDNLSDQPGHAKEATQLAEVEVCHRSLRVDFVRFFALSVEAVLEFFAGTEGCPRAGVKSSAIETSGLLPLSSEENKNPTPPPRRRRNMKLGRPQPSTKLGTRSLCPWQGPVGFKEQKLQEEAGRFDRTVPARSARGPAATCCTSIAHSGSAF
jgi:hypothetical protein